MAKIGRNERCPCGSGKKYKNCHGGNSAGKPDASGPLHSQKSVEKVTQPGMSVPINYWEWSLPGERLMLTWCNKTSQEPSVNSTSEPIGNPGDYAAIVILYRPGYLLDEPFDTKTSDLLVGNSHVQLTDIGDLRIGIRLEESQETIDIASTQNPDGFIGKLITNAFSAQNFSDARQIAFQAVAPTLSQFSIECNVPMSIYRMEIIEQATGNRSIDLVVPFPEIEFTPKFHLPIQLGQINSKFRGYASLYREAHCTNSPLYALLCFYRIVDGLDKDYKALTKEQKAAKTASKGAKAWFVPSKKSQFLPWLNALYRCRFNWIEDKLGHLFPPVARGKTISVVLDKFIRPVRNRIAHSLFGDHGDEPWVEDLSLLNEVEQWLPLTQMIVRRLLKDEFPDEFLSGIPDDGLEDFCNPRPKKVKSRDG